ncbi:MAG: ACP phosphodiesterase [Flavobacteriaceae bacterium]
MNYLAHIYLSGDDPGVQIGNFIADGVKGNHYLDYPLDWQKGILLHRSIDGFTDGHPIFKKHARQLFPVHRHYSRVIVDLFYDHFLAANWPQFSTQSLAVFSQRFYQLLTIHQSQLPERFGPLVGAMQKHNWLSQYASLTGLRTILHQMSQRAKFPCAMNDAVDDLEAAYTHYEKDFFSFFSDLEKFSQEKLHILNQKFHSP